MSSRIWLLILLPFSVLALTGLLVAAGLREFGAQMWAGLGTWRQIFRDGAW